MSAYHLHARLFEGTLAAPTANELQTEESDDLGQLERFAQVLARKGFAVWVYRHDARRRSALDREGFVVVAEWRPYEAERVR